MSHNIKEVEKRKQAGSAMKPTLFQILPFFCTKMFRVKHFETKKQGKSRKPGKPEKPAYKTRQAGSAMKPTSTIFKMFV